MIAPQMKRHGGTWRAIALALVVISSVSISSTAMASRLAWLDDVIQGVIRRADDGADPALRSGDEVVQGATRLFEGGQESLTSLARRYESLGGTSTARAATGTEAILESRFTKLIGTDEAMAKTFANLAPAEKRVVVEMSEAAQRLARRYPDQAGSMIRKMGTEGLMAVRVYGDDVAETLAQQGPAAVNVLRKTGRPGWRVFQEVILPHKKKLIAAGVFGLFLANPEQFVTTTGELTEKAVKLLTEAGVDLAGAIGSGAASGFGAAMTASGLGHPAIQAALIGVLVLIVLAAAWVVVGGPIRMLVRPLAWVFPGGSSKIANQSTKNLQDEVRFPI